MSKNPFKVRDRVLWAGAFGRNYTGTIRKLINGTRVTVSWDTDDGTYTDSTSPVSNLKLINTAQKIETGKFKIGDTVIHVNETNKEITGVIKEIVSDRASVDWVKVGVYSYPLTMLKKVSAPEKQSSHNQAIIKTEKVINAGVPARKILSFKALACSELPEAYVNSNEPRFYTSAGKLYISSIPDKYWANIAIGDVISEVMFQKMLKILHAGGSNLQKINAKIRADATAAKEKENFWKGEETFTI